MTADHPSEILARAPKKGCPACSQPMRGALFVCSSCWWKVPGNERVAIHQMLDRRQPIASKLEKIVRILKAKAAQP